MWQVDYFGWSEFKTSLTGCCYPGIRIIYKRNNLSFYDKVVVYKTQGTHLMSPHMSKNPTHLNQHFPFSSLYINLWVRHVSRQHSQYRAKLSVERSQSGIFLLPNSKNCEPLSKSVILVLFVVMSFYAILKEEIM